jgi:hypothetical protein
MLDPMTATHFPPNAVAFRIGVALGIGMLAAQHFLFHR